MRQNRVILSTLTCTALLSSCTGATTKKPDVLMIVVDDMGFSDLGVYGGEIHTTNIDRLANQGTMYNRFYTSSISAPTRSMLLTGVDNHQNGLGAMPPVHSVAQYAELGYEGSLNKRVTTISEELKSNGYHTVMAGKWHLGHTLGHLPVDRGFDKSFTLAGGSASHFSDAFAVSPSEEPSTLYYENDKLIDSLPAEFYSTTFYTDKMIEYITKTPSETPLFGYLAYTAPHDPLHIIEEWADKYKGCYDAGYEAIRKARFEKQKLLGMIPKDAQYSDNLNMSEKWNALDGDTKMKQARQMEIYAAMVEYMDYSVGRVLDALEKSGRLDNTLIVFMSDNGANPKEAIIYPGNTEEMLAGKFDNSYDNYGKRGSFISVGESWAEVSNTPLSRYKTTTNEGGIRTPLIISGNGFNNSKRDTENILHVTDLFPTILEYTSTPVNRAKELAPLYGKSIIGKEQVRMSDEPICIEIMSTRAVIKGDWKAVYDARNGWKLHNLKTDIFEMNDLSKSEPEKLSELLAIWDKYAEEVGFIEWDGAPIIFDIGAEKYYEFNPEYKKGLTKGSIQLKM